MSLQEILAIEQTNTHHIYFYREGVRRCLTTIACGILLAAFTGCGDNQSTSFDDDLPRVGNLVEINILTNGIESFADAEEVATRSALAGGMEAEQTVETVHTQVQPLEGGGLLVATVKASKAARVAAASPTNTRATALTNTTLRVLAYDSDGQYVDECMYNVDGSGTAAAMSGQELVVPARATPYTFYCYSPGVCYSNTATKEVSVDAADAFAFGTQRVTINGSSSTQTVNFATLAQKRASIKLSVTSTDAASVVNSCTATLSGQFANSATFSLTSGAYSSFATASTQSKPFAANAAEQFILPHGSTGEMDLILSNLVVNGMALTSPRIKIPTIELAAGTRYTLAINVQKVIPTAPFVILPEIDLKVAKGNLMRANGDGHWYLAPDQGYYTYRADGGDYFCWGIANPTSINNGGGTSMNDLTAGCVAVLGAGWRVPTYADHTALINAGSVWGSYLSQRGASNGCYFGTATEPAAADRDNSVFLPAAGYRYSNDSPSNGGRFGRYWSIEPYGHNRAYSLYFNSSSINGSYDSYRDSGLFVRCVASL